MNTDMKSKILKYASCDHYSRKQGNLSLNEGVRSSLAEKYIVLPLYEQALADRKFLRNHSLKNNESLRCRWLEYQRINLSEKPEPFNLPHVKDYHFYNYHTCYKPELSINSKPNHRYCLSIGPGVDKNGEMPIPSDIGYRKSGMMVERKIHKKNK